MAPNLIPKLIGLEISESGKEGGMVSEYFKLSSTSTPAIQRQLGKMIAEMHRVPSGEEGYDGKFGFERNTFCGVTEQDNGWEDDWGVFFRDKRLGHLVSRIGDQEVQDAWEEMLRK